MSDQEDTRAKQLEEARKRVEELKKKSKKDKKKKKQAKNTEEMKEISESEYLDKEATAELPEVTSAVEEEKTVEEDKAVEEEKAINEAEIQTADKADEAAELEAPSIAVLNSSVELAAAKESSNDASQLFDNDANDESDFMDTIKKQKEAEEIQRLKTELEATTAECKKLKFINMEHETTIEDLQSEVKHLQKQLQNNQQELQTALQNLTEAQSKLTLQQANDSAPLQFAQFPGSTNQKAVGDTYQEPSNEHYKPEVDRAALNKWRCWNVDMTSWRSIGSGPIVEF